MSEPIQDFKPDSDAKPLADALRAGTEMRSHLSESQRGEDEARLGSLGDLEGLTAVAKPGPAAPLMKAARRVLHVLVRPWLSMQTIYNRELARRFQQVTTRTHDLDRRVPQIEHAMQTLEERLDGLVSSRPAQEPSDPIVVRLESLFALYAHSRLPAPPARILVCGPAEHMAASLVSFGFDVRMLGSRPGMTGVGVHHLDSTASLGDASCDAAIWHRLDTSQVGPISSREIARVLVPGGQLFTSTRMAVYDAVMAAAQFEPLEIRSTLLLQQANGSWSAIGTPDGGDETVAFVDARRSDVPDR